MAFRAKLVALLTRFRGGFRYRERIPEVDDDTTGCGRPVCWSVLTISKSRSGKCRTVS